MNENLNAINELNKVEGFNPADFLRKIKNESGEEQLYLDVKFRKLWFRLKYPKGKITKRLIKIDEQVAIVESKIYLDRNDNEQAYISSAMAQRQKTTDDVYGMRYVETAETAAVGRALADAGFGIQFSDSEENDSTAVDSPFPKFDFESENKKIESDDKPLPDENIVIQDEKPEMNENMPVDELLNIMTLEYAKKVIIPIGYKKGQTLGEAAVKSPESVVWFAQSYRGKNNILRAAAIKLLDTAQ